MCWWYSLGAWGLLTSFCRGQAVLQVMPLSGFSHAIAYSNPQGVMAWLVQVGTLDYSNTNYPIIYWCLRQHSRPTPPFLSWAITPRSTRIWGCTVYRWQFDCVKVGSWLLFAVATTSSIFVSAWPLILLGSCRGSFHAADFAHWVQGTTPMSALYLVVVFPHWGNMQRMHFAHLSRQVQSSLPRLWLRLAY
jgi:hypothetical protein